MTSTSSEMRPLPKPAATVHEFATRVAPDEPSARQIRHRLLGCLEGYDFLQHREERFSVRLEDLLEDRPELRCLHEALAQTAPPTPAGRESVVAELIAIGAAIAQHEPTEHLRRWSLYAFDRIAAYLPPRQQKPLVQGADEYLVVVGERVVCRTRSHDRALEVFDHYRADPSVSPPRLFSPASTLSRRSRRPRIARRTPCRLPP